jgi:hypothetical protein
MEFAMTISTKQINELQVLLQQQTGTMYDLEKAQAAGRAILRLAGIKLYQQYEKDTKYDKKH